MKVAIASDHGGVELKKELIRYLEELKIETIDMSEENTPTDDYPDFASIVCKSIQDKKSDLGILICRSGIGMSIAANKHKGIYCARVISPQEAIISRKHNGVNVIAVDGDGRTPLFETKEIIKKFIETQPLDDERHIRRYNKIIKIESEE